MPHARICFLLTGCLLAVMAGGAAADELFRDDFDGTALEAGKWGETQGHVSVGGGYATFNLETYNPSYPGQYALDSRLSTGQVYSPSTDSGIQYEARLRVNAAPPGLVAAFYSIHPNPSVGGDSEIDWELLTKRADCVLTTGWSAGQQCGELRAPAGYNMADWNTYAIRWFPDHSIEWWLNGQLWRRMTTANMCGLPYLTSLPMRMDVSLWTPTPWLTSWTDAYDPNFQLASNPSDNQIYTMDVDYVSVSSFIVLPHIECSPTSFTRHVVYGSSLPDDTLSVANTAGGGTLSYTLSSEAAWLAVTPATGSTGGPANAHTLSYSVSGLWLGTYTANISIESAGADNSPQTVPVTVIVDPLIIPGDVDVDMDVDQSDFGLLQACLLGSATRQLDPACARADLNGDGYVDANDVTAFKKCFTGPGMVGDPDCNRK